MSGQIVQVPGTSVFRPHSITTMPVSHSRTNGKSRWAKSERLINKELANLHNTKAAVESGPDLEEVLWTLYEESRRFIDTSNFALAIYDERTDTLAFPLIFDRGERVEPRSVTLSDDQGFISLVFDSPNPLLVRDFSKMGFAVETAPIRPSQPIRSWLSVPIRNSVVASGETQGMIVVWSDRPNAFTNHQSQQVSELGALAATTIHNNRLFAVKDTYLHKSTWAKRGWDAEVEEQIRRELARALHDGPTQLVSGIAMCLDFCRRALEKDPTLLLEQISCMQDMAKRAVHQMRTLLFELRPLALETEGLGAALQVLLDRRQKEIKTTRLTLGVETCQPNDEISRQKARVESAIFVIVQEAINNALKYAQADHIEVHLKETLTAIHVAVVDDGKGFDVDTVMYNYGQRGSLGMISMQERAELIGAKLDVRSVPGQGTRIAIVVPKALV